MKPRPPKPLFFALLFLCAAPLFSQNRPVALFVSAEAGEDKSVVVRWEFPAKRDPEILEIQLFRAKRPFASFQDAQGKEPVARLDGSQKSYVDTLSAPGDYFYAVLALTQRGLYKIVIPGVNATAKGVRPKVEAKIQDTGEQAKMAEALSDESVFPEPKMRNAPLPNPGALLGMNHGKARMSAASKSAAKELGSKKPRERNEFKSPHFFEEDMFSPEGGDEYTLFEALRAGLAPKKYPESVALLKDFLSVHRSQSASERAQFYLGESYYFCKDYESAVRCFLSVQDAFPELSKRWIDSSLDLLEIE